MDAAVRLEHSEPVILDLFQIGDPVEHRGIVVAPLFPRRDPVASYVTLDEALSQGLRVTEVDDAGTVPELVVENPLDTSVLLYDGEELVGAKQNRILNVSVLVEARSSLKIPVSCVEQGRWSPVSVVFAPGRHVSHAHLRRRKAEAQAARPLARGISQSVVWGELHERMASMSVDSPTGASSDCIALARMRCARSRISFPCCQVNVAPCWGSGRISASISSPGPTRSRDSGRSSVPGTCSTRWHASAARLQRLPGSTGSSRLSAARW